MQKKQFNPYGYKVGYREIGSRLFIRQFITKTYRQAHRSLLFYRKYGHAGCHKKDIERFNYSIKPITKKEYLAGIWDELPFHLYLNVKNIRIMINNITLHIFSFRWGYRRIVQNQMSTTAKNSCILLYFLL